MRSLWPLFFGLCAPVMAGRAQTAREVLGGPDSHETGEGPHGHLLGDWHGKRTRLATRGVTFDFQYLTDVLTNVKSEQRGRLSDWSRIRGTFDVSFDSAGVPGLHFHATGLWQRGTNLGAYLGLITSPSGMSSENTFRLDSWWVEKRWFDERLVGRIGQFAGQDFYGAQHFAASFIFEPMGYALSNLFNAVEVFDPPSTSAAEIRVVPVPHLYLKSMVMAGARDPFSINRTGFIPQFTGNGVTVWEIGFTPGRKASTVRAFDNVESRKGYSGLYQFGGSYNPGTFTSPTSVRSSNHLLYAMASQAIWRKDKDEAKGLDATTAYDWSPVEINHVYSQLTAGLRYNEPLHVPFHNTMSIGFVQSNSSSHFLPPGMLRWRPERALEFNALLDVAPMLLVQPVVQYFVNTGGGTGHDVVLGFRTKVDF